MMKNTVKRLGAAALALCMMLSMMISASAVTKYYVKVEISDEKNNSVSYTSASVSLDNDVLVDTVQQVLAAQYRDIESNFTVGGYEPVIMGGFLREGFNVYEAAAREGGNPADWTAWVDAKYARVDGAEALKDYMNSLDTKVGALTKDQAYVMTYEPDQAYAAHWPNDPANANVYKFTVTLISKNVVSGGGVPSTPSTPTEYRIDLAKVDNATVKLSDTDAAKGDKVTVTVTADEGYKAESVTVKSGSGEVAVTDNGDGTYTFTMPEGVVTVTVEVKAETPDEPDHSEVCKADDYKDVDLNAWYHNAVCYVLDKGYMSGFNADEFGPEKTVTRAMVAQIFYNMESTPAVTSGKEFPDVAYGQWYYNAITWAAANGVVSGYGDGSYQPDKSVTREELAQMFFNYAKSKGLTGDEAADLSKFMDEHEISDWAEAALSWGVGAGLMSGKGGNMIDANGNGVRAEIAQMIMNFCENIQK
ncbi:MAG: S-layer homology domain-containing protein [Oscillospiraceae bacterium]|nr:S-layer homology domain-containing protein [Oscillospiraceae bacterium]